MKESSLSLLNFSMWIFLFITAVIVDFKLFMRGEVCIDVFIAGFLLFVTVVMMITSEEYLKKRLGEKTEEQING